MRESMGPSKPKGVMKVKLGGAVDHRGRPGEEDGTGRAPSRARRLLRPALPGRR